MIFDSVANLAKGQLLSNSKYFVLWSNPYKTQKLLATDPLGDSASQTLVLYR